MTVFPGGSVDPADHVDVRRLDRPRPGAVGRTPRPPARARGGPRQGRRARDVRGVRRAAGGRRARRPRRATCAPTSSRAAPPSPTVLGERPLRADLLRAWSRWITPPSSPRRYDTAFLVASSPSAQDADAHTTEAVEARWWHPAEALERWDGGRAQAHAARPTRRCARSTSTPTARPCSPPPSTATIEPMHPELRLARRRRHPAARRRLVKLRGAAPGHVARGRRRWPTTRPR